MKNKFLDSIGMVSLWNKIQKTFVRQETGKGLSTNDFTTAEQAKLEGIAPGANLYVHPTTTPHDTGLYKIQTNIQGHVVEAEVVTKEDITALGLIDKDYVDQAIGNAMKAEY